MRSATTKIPAIIATSIDVLIAIQFFLILIVVFSVVPSEEVDKLNILVPLSVFEWLFSWLFYLADAVLSIIACFKKTDRIFNAILFLTIIGSFSGLVVNFATDSPVAILISLFLRFVIVILETISFTTLVMRKKTKSSETSAEITDSQT